MPLSSERLRLLLFPVLALVSPVLEAYGTLSIPVFTLPTLLVIGAFGAFGLCGGAVLAVLAPSERSRTLRHVLFVASLVGMALLILDVAAQGHRVLSTVAGSRIGRLGTLAGLSALLLAGFWMVRPHASRLLFVASVAFFVATVSLNLSAFRFEAPPTQQPTRPQPLSDEPPLIYILVDGAMGVEGLALAPGGQGLSEELRRMFQAHGFRLYGAAFSRHFVSGRSIPNVLNFDVRDDSWGPILRHHTNLKVNSKLFEGLSDDGYQVVVYGTEHIDFCFEVATRCEVLPSFNPFSSYISDQQVKSKALLRIVWTAFVESYLVYRASHLLFSWLDTGPVSPFAGIDAYAFPRWFDRFEADVMTSPDGTAYFAHLLMPHAPYVFDRECRDTGRGIVGYFLAEERQLEGAALDAERVRVYEAYQAQYRCLAKRLDGFLNALSGVPQFRDATIVIHGDHGARISAGQFAEHLSDRDMIDNYSALYAIRKPGVQPGYDSRKTSVQRLSAEYFSRSAAELGPDNLTVAIDSQQPGRVVLRVMPDIAADSQSQ